MLNMSHTTTIPGQESHILKTITVEAPPTQTPLRPNYELQPFRHAHEHAHVPHAPGKLPEAKEVKVHPSSSGQGGEKEDASILFVGTATTVM
jgi:hypothetical protein